MALPWLAANPRTARKQAYGAAQRAVIDPDRVPDVGALLGDGHGPTPLYALPALAQRLGVGEIRVKDESQRFGFGAFKALGGVFAVHEYVTAHHTEAPAELVFTTASSGNHGRAVALGAQSVGAFCTIFLPKFTSAEKEAAIRALGAQVIRVDGDYEAAVAECRLQAEEKGWIIISDTSWEGYEQVPRDVMRGYTQLADEIVRQWKAGPTHLFVQAGVGGLAAAVIGYLWAKLPHRPVFVIVEPQSADCWFQSNRAGKPALASGDAATAMGGLACREISPLTWPVLGLRRRLVHDHRGGSGDAGAPPVRPSARGRPGDHLRTVRLRGSCRADTRLHRRGGVQGPASRQAVSRVLLINSEGNLGEGSA